jgi:hypothetical protein
MIARMLAISMKRREIAFLEICMSKRALGDLLELEYVIHDTTLIFGAIVSVLGSSFDTACDDSYAVDPHDRQPQFLSSCLCCPLPYLTPLFFSFNIASSK